MAETLNKRIQPQLDRERRENARRYWERKEMANGKLIIPSGIAASAVAAAEAEANAEADRAAQHVARATETSFSGLLDRLADDPRTEGQADAILAGAIYALVRFTFARCWSDKVPRLSTELLKRWAPMMMAGVVSAVKDAEQ